MKNEKLKGRDHEGEGKVYRPSHGHQGPAKGARSEPEARPEDGNSEKGRAEGKREPVPGCGVYIRGNSDCRKLLGESPCPLIWTR